MNISRPLVTATANASHVHVNTSEAMAVKERLVEARPRSRRSIIRIVPNTMVKPSTCTDSISGNRYSVLRMPVARREASSEASSPATSIVTAHTTTQQPVRRACWPFVPGAPRRATGPVPRRGLPFTAEARYSSHGERPHDYETYPRTSTDAEQCVADSLTGV